MKNIYFKVYQFSNDYKITIEIYKDDKKVKQYNNIDYIKAKEIIDLLNLLEIKQK